MKVTFQAKDIQEMLAIARQRYEYIATKIGISPEIAEVVGRGKAHLYSFRNALQFAITHPMNAMGLPPRTIRWILDALDSISQIDRFPIYESDKSIRDHLFVTGYGQDRRVAIGESIDNAYWIDEAIMGAEPEEIVKELTVQSIRGSADLKDVECYVSFNLGVIKERVREYARG
jgi:hypothetical protein